jgi:type IV secretory pathway VirB2 component (pilin)
MKHLSSILIFSLSLFFSSGTIANEAQQCGFTQPCPDGLACVGAIGANNNGICVMTGPQIVLCKTVKYFDKKLASVFAIFAVVMIGIAFFLGKISWGMIVSVIIGIGIIKGATTIIKKVSGQNEGYCESGVTDYSALNCTAGSTDISSKLNTNKVYNLQPTNGCNVPLTCYKKTCSNASISGTYYIIINDTHTNALYSSGSPIFVPESTTSINVTTCTMTDYTNPEKTCTKTSVSCTDFTQTSTKDYFYCNNSCTNVKFSDSYNGGTYTSCAQVAATK